MFELQDVLGIVLNVLETFFENMEDILSYVFVFFVIVAFVFDDSNKKKKRSKKNRSTGMPLPPPDLDIPTLENDPNIKVQQEITFEPPEEIVPRGVTNNVSENYRRKYEQMRREQERSLKTNKPSEEKTNEPALNADDALNAMILSEIFDKPKALRRR